MIHCQSNTGNTVSRLQLLCILGCVRTCCVWEDRR